MEANPRMTPPAIDYQQLAEEYARHRRVHPGVLERIQLLASQSGAHDLLEVGCGSGNYLEALAATGLRVAGIDPSSAMLDQLTARLPDAETGIGRAEAIPYPDASFDLVYSVDVIHHVWDRDAYFREARRVLRPGGWVVTVTDSEEDITARVPLSSHFPETVAHELRRYPAIGVLRDEMEQAGFAELDERRVRLLYPLTDLSGYRDRAYSSLHLISEEEHARGMARLAADLDRGAVTALSLYTLVTGRKPTGPEASASCENASALSEERARRG